MIISTISDKVLDGCSFVVRRLARKRLGATELGELVGCNEGAGKIGLKGEKRME